MNFKNLFSLHSGAEYHTGKTMKASMKRGATAVEFALVAQMFFFLLLASFDVVGMMNAYSTLQWSVTTAARVVMADPTKTTTDVQTAAQNAANLAGYNTSNGTNFTVTSAACGATTCFTIVGTYTYKFVTAKAFCPSSGGALCQIALSESVVAPIGPSS